MSSAPDRPSTCSDCRYSWTHIKFRKTGSHGDVTLCTLSNRPTQKTRTACSLAKPRESVLRPARTESQEAT